MKGRYTIKRIFLKILKYWYILLFAFVVSFIIFLFINKNSKFEKQNYDEYNNKVDINDLIQTDDKINVTEKRSNTDSLEDWTVEPPTIGANIEHYTPPDIVPDSKEAIEYIEKTKQDPFHVYRKTISWSSGYLAEEQLQELIELIWYHKTLYHENDIETIVLSYPTPEILEENGLKTTMDVTSDGVLILNLITQTLSSEKDILNENLISYMLKYNFNGIIQIEERVIK